MDEVRAVDRRMILKASAWSVPTILATSSVPLAVASPECPVVPSGSAWTTAWLTDPAVGDGTVERRPTSAPSPFVEEFWSYAEGLPPTRPAVGISVFVSIDFVAGRTYNIDWFAGANYGNLVESTSRAATITFEIGSSGYLWRAATRPNQGSAIVLPSNATGNNYANYAPYSVSYTPTTSGAQVLRFSWFTGAATPTTLSADDIAVTLPRISCA
ncbi:hypothetical protein [Pseudoclavibacter helvolus]|uniref:hypothetical protein n=1 Tax=Pseudoclavibacter helvolus TaxID=255205 RepID=UPI003C7405F4